MVEGCGTSGYQSRRHARHFIQHQGDEADVAAHAGADGVDAEDFSEVLGGLLYGLWGLGVMGCRCLWCAKTHL